MLYFAENAREEHRMVVVFLRSTGSYILLGSWVISEKHIFRVTYECSYQSKNNILDIEYTQDVRDKLSALSLDFRKVL